MVDILTEIKINCAREIVAEYSANPENAPNWYLNIKSAKWKTPKPLKVGSQFIFKAQFLRKKLAYIYEIIEYVPGQKLVMHAEDEPFPMQTIYTWESIGANTTRMSVQNRGVLTGLTKLIAPVISFAMRKYNTKDLERLKQILEKKC